eukprot:gb/GFBE01054015.1/.p1 GENE.gb/GFBE01054015.1/~~gb/GFBE01054015.1/.p1  ORF type:complete len:269 (+),score=45.98 gb/GFBE01054015.1/:1-807(+)
MVRQEDVDSLFARSGDASKHTFLFAGCLVFDLTVYPLMIWILFIDVPEFLQPPESEEEARMFSFVKVGLVVGFSLIVCVYQLILFDLSRQHCTRMCTKIFYRAKKQVPYPEMEGAANKPFEAWDQRWDASGTQPRLQPKELESGVAVATAKGGQPQRKGHLESVPEETEVNAVVAVPLAGVQTTGVGHPLGTMPAVDMRCGGCLRSLAAELSSGSVALAACGHVLCPSCSPSVRKGSVCPHCQPQATAVVSQPVATKHKEKTVAISAQ